MYTDRLWRWSYTDQDYKLVLVPPADYILSTDNMEEIITCPNCGKQVTFGQSYTSMEYHTAFGLAYPVCKECYEKEVKARLKFKEE